MTFRATLELNGKTVATVNGHSYRTSIGVVGGRSMLPVSAEHRAAEPAVQSAYDALSRSRQRQLADPIGQAKGADTKARRIAKALEALRGG